MCDLITVHPDGNVNVGNKFHGNPFSCCQDISLKTTNVNLMVVLEERSGVTKVIRIYSLGL